MWLSVAASVVALLAFLGIENYEELRRALSDDAENSPSPGPEDTDLSATGGADTGGTPGDGSGDGSTGTSESNGDNSGDQWTPTPDPTLEAYQEVDAGDCLHNWMTGESSWSSEVPEDVACGADGAALWVSYVSDTTGSCPSDAGRSHLSYTSDEGETVALCVSRRFEVGQCFLGVPDGGANLMSWVDCDNSSVPAPYSQIYSVTGVYAAPANHTPGECARTQNDQSSYASWFVEDETVLVCAVVYAN